MITESRTNGELWEQKRKLVLNAKDNAAKSKFAGDDIPQLKIARRNRRHCGGRLSKEFGIKGNKRLFLS